MPGAPASRLRRSGLDRSSDRPSFPCETPHRDRRIVIAVIEHAPHLGDIVIRAGGLTPLNQARALRLREGGAGDWV